MYAASNDFMPIWMDMWDRKRSYAAGNDFFVSLNESLQQEMLSWDFCWQDVLFKFSAKSNVQNPSIQ